MRKNTAGGASHKIKSDRWYYYYRCEKCRGNIREHEIENSIKEMLSDIFEYDSVVNEFFLPVLQNKIHNPKEDYEKEITNLNNKKVRIRKAYIDELFRFLYKGIIINHNKTEPTYTKTSLFLCEKRRFFVAWFWKGVVLISN